MLDHDNVELAPETMVEGLKVIVAVGAAVAASARCVRSVSRHEIKSETAIRDVRKRPVLTAPAWADLD